MSCRIVGATREAVERHVEGLVILDASARQEFGAVYSDEVWDAEAFLKDIPGKFELSALAVEGRRLCGFWVASAATGRTAHTHRVLVAAEGRGFGVADELCAEVHRRARERGASMMTLWVHPGNLRAITFYQRMGYHALESGERTMMSCVL